MIRDNDAYKNLIAYLDKYPHAIMVSLKVIVQSEEGIYDKQALAETVESALKYIRENPNWKLYAAKFPKDTGLPYDNDFFMVRFAEEGRADREMFNLCKRSGGECTRINPEDYDI